MLRPDIIYPGCVLLNVNWLPRTSRHENWAPVPSPITLALSDREASGFCLTNEKVMFRGMLLDKVTSSEKS
jgi:hypothetical protein